MRAEAQQNSLVPGVQLLAQVPRVRVVAAARRASGSAELVALQARHGPQWLTLVQLDLADQESINVRTWHPLRLT